MLITK